jgi:pimeloyl-ACP methyl ester carboxylesterase
MAILMVVLEVLGIIVGLFVLYLLIVALVPGLSVSAQPLAKGKSTSAPDVQPFRSRRDVRFKVQGASVSAWLFLPEDLSALVPCIIMGHGFGGTRDMGLEPYAVRFQEAGFGVLVFDYRHFGHSDGEPRQLAWIPYQLQDYSAAIEYARGLEEIDPARIALWGTSFSGGHVVVSAARDKDIACVVAQCPALDGRATAVMGRKLVGIGQGLRLIMHGQRDLVRSWLGLSPDKLPIVGKPGSMACMTAPDVYEAYAQLAPAGFVNEVCARILVRGDKYRPVTKARKVRCPVLIQICEHDNLTPISAAEETARRLGDLAEVKRYPIGHFDIYVGDDFERSVSDQLEFFRRHL